MRAGASAILATGRASIVDLVTLTVPRSVPVEPDTTGTATIPRGTATILGTEYPTAIMPDGKEWMAENLKWTNTGMWWNNGASDDGDGRYYSRDQAWGLIAPAISGSGWRLPTLAEINQLVLALGGVSGGGKLKATGTAYWNTPNTGATDQYGFAARGAGYYSVMTGSQAKKQQFRMWSADESSSPEPNTCWAKLEYNSGDITLAGSTGGFIAQYLFSVRLVRDYTPPAPVDPTAVIRWTSHDRPLRFQGAVFQGLPGAVWNRGPRSDQVGSEVSTLACSVAGDLLVPWRTHPTDAAQVDQIDLSELAVLGLLEGATLQIDEAVLDSFPGAPAGESAADLPIGQVTTAVVLGEVVEASLDALSVAMRVRAFQHRAGASVPRAVFAPTCRWDFAGPECGYASQWAERTALETTEESIRLSALQAEDFGSVVPLSGRNMGIRRTLGVGDNDGLERTYALPEPWPWPMADNTQVAVGFECSKGLGGLTGRPSCTALLRQTRFGGFPGMPPPEGA